MLRFGNTRGIAGRRPASYAACVRSSLWSKTNAAGGSRGPPAA